MMLSLRRTARLLSGLLALYAGATQAQDSPGEVQWTGSGFLTLAAGKVLSGSADAATDYGFRCPCLITDYGQAGVLEAGAWRLGPDSKLGLQGTAASADGRYAITGQVVARGAGAGKVNVEWLYATADLGSRWTLQVGRKRLPILALSEVQDVGYSLPWIHLPPQVYGWEIVNYNGANLLYRDQWRDVSMLVNVFGGSETVKGTPYNQIYYGREDRSDTRWSRLHGIEAKLARGGWELRGVYIASHTQGRDVAAGKTDFSAPLPQKISAVSLSYDDSSWVLRGEHLYINRQSSYGSDRASLLAAGRRHGPWLALASWSHYRQDNSTTGDPAEGHDLYSLVLRREIDSASALALQLDRWQDRSAPDYAFPHGERRALTLAYTRVF